MKKEGFVFIESMTVLIVVILSLTLLVASYSLAVRKSKENENYDLPADKYLLYSISNLGNISQAILNNNVFVLDKNNCDTKLSGKIDNCKKMFEENNLVYLIVIHDLKSELESGSPKDYNSGAIEYLKTLKRCGDSKCTIRKNYVVGVFYRNGNYYYASLEI